MSRSLITRLSTLGLCAVCCVATISSAFAEQDPAVQIATQIEKIVKVELTVQTSEPPNLIIKATGEVPTGGYSPKKVKLERVVYAKPPEDGIQDYHLTAVKPEGIVAQVISQVSAVETWKDFRKEAPWFKGVRIHGVGDGIVVEKLPK